MEIKLIPYDKNQFPLKGLLIQGASVIQWVREIQHFDLPLASLQIYPVPDNAPNTVWGCLVIASQDIPRDKTGRHQVCQALTPNIFIPERATLFPMPSAAEIERLFGNGRYIIHPDFGWVALPEALPLQDLIAAPVINPLRVTKPASSVNPPATIRSFQMHAPPLEEVMANLQNSFPTQKQLDKKDLNLWEKTRLAFYRAILKKGNTSGAGSNDGAAGQTTTNKIAEFFSKIFGSGKSMDRMLQDFDALEERNKKQIERLMDMLRENPEEALHYAIPLDENYTTRGSSAGEMKISRWQTDFSLFGKTTRTSGGTFNAGDHFYTLQQQYHATAEALIQKKNYHKAAFVYLNLLKAYGKAAETLEAGKYHQEAATIYIKYLNDKKKAAICFENGNMVHEAITLYDEIGDHEKVGDLYTSIANDPQATAYYTKAMNAKKSTGQYIMAALIGLHKMKNKPVTQALLLEGWRMQRDPVNCLNMYIAMINEPGDREKEIQILHRSEVSAENREQFLQVVKYEYKKNDATHDPLKEIAYEIIAAHIAINPAIVSELKEFNPENKELFKDTMRFKVNKQQG